MNDIQHYNAFGSVVVKRDRITVTLTAAKGNRSIHRVLGKDVELSQIQNDETCVAEIGVLIEDKRSKVIAYEIVKPKSGTRLISIPEAEQTIKELANIM